jgi:hypothetical protein
VGWRFQPVDDNCIDCGKPVDIHNLHYIVYDWEGRVYRRECEKCHQEWNQRRDRDAGKL